MKILIKNGIIVNEGSAKQGSLLIDDDRITAINYNDNSSREHYDKIIDAAGCFVLPGVIDEHVHFREPGITQKADMDTESRAAAYGGVTSFLDMPNTSPLTTTTEALQQKMDIAAMKSHVNYGFFYGATNANGHTIATLDRTQIPGIKLFMGASTGNMLVDKLGALIEIFSACAHTGLPVMTHCEDSDRIKENMKQIKAVYGDDPDITLHPLIRSAEACFDSSALAVSLAQQTGAQLHIAHISTARELALIEKWDKTANALPKITGEACIAHLWFDSSDYIRLGTRIKCNPAVKTKDDRQALRDALVSGRITTVATDHAPHLLTDKQGGSSKAASGMPMIQYSLVAMLELVSQGVITIEQLVWLMCHNPARRFAIHQRGFIRTAYKADITIVKPNQPWTVMAKDIQSKCGWSPMEGACFSWKVETTICNGHIVYHQGIFDDRARGEALRFRMD